jgi:predicted homoserine dehydrogenase-like protein
MIYRALFDSLAPARTVRAGVIGTGHYGTAVITQSPAIPSLEVSAVADIDVEAARQALGRAGFPAEACDVCESRGEALYAIGRGRRAIVADASLLMELPLDVIVESTGSAEAGARHARAAIQHGKHVAMVTKETDAVVGPILKHRADRAGVVYTAVDGDQHGLLIALVTWARDLGLEVLCGGKACEHDLVLDTAAGTISSGPRQVPLAGARTAAFGRITAGAAATAVAERHVALQGFGAPAGYDVTEMTIAANATGLQPDTPELHGPVLRIREIPDVMCPSADGGILNTRGVIDAVTCLRDPDGVGLGGGVFIVVGCANEYSRHILTSKGLIANQRQTAALIFRPYHLCGVETPISLLCAGLLGVPTGASKYRPRFDTAARATHDLKAGERVGNDHSPTLRAVMLPAQPMAGDASIPLHMASGNVLRVDVAAGTILATSMIEPPRESALWELRAEQDRHFLLEGIPTR